MSIPANKRHKGGYIEGFHKKTNVDKRALRKFYDEVVETEKRIAQLEEELHPQPKVSEAPAECLRECLRWAFNNLKFHCLNILLHKKN